MTTFLRPTGYIKCFVTRKTECFYVCLLFSWMTKCFIQTDMHLFRAFKPSHKTIILMTADLLSSNSFLQGVTALFLARLNRTNTDLAWGAHTHGHFVDQFRLHCLPFFSGDKKELVRSTTEESDSSESSFFASAKIIA